MILTDLKSLGVPQMTFDPAIISKLDLVQRLAVTLDVDEEIAEDVGSAYRKLVETEQRNQVGYPQAPLNCGGLKDASSMFLVRWGQGRRLK